MHDRVKIISRALLVVDGQFLGRSRGSVASVLRFIVAESQRVRLAWQCSGTCGNAACREDWPKRHL